MIKLLFGIVSLFLLSSIEVNAEEVYYRNNNGLPFTEYQYQMMVERFDEDIVANMKYKPYQMLDVSNITEENYEQEVLEPSSNSRATYYETTCKKIVISKACTSSFCVVNFSNDWKCIPVVRSYDVSGIRLSSTNFYNTNYDAYYESNGTATDPAGSRGASNGLGYAFKVPSSGDIGYSLVTAYVKPTGAVYASYQHGVKSMSLSRALDFTFTATGQGGVFEWGSYDEYFDCMGGLYITLI